jgi:hypothetical protein
LSTTTLLKREPVKSVPGTRAPGGCTAQIGEPAAVVADEARLLYEKQP